MNKLHEILEVKRTEVERLRPHAELLRKKALERNDIRGFRQALDRGEGNLALIAEIKKASPSAGVIAEDFDPIDIARTYQAAGAHALSVLTDKQFFQGDIGYLMEVRAQVDIPLLRKDFIIDPLQVYEAAIAGADAILLIVAALTDDRLRELLGLAEECQLDALVEVHTLAELDRALDTDAAIIGINNRDLTTFSVSLETTEQLSEHVPDDLILVSESGIRDKSDTSRLLRWGVDAILVGETLMRAPDVPAKTRELLDVLP